MASSASEEAFGSDLKLILVGNQSTGKTSLINRFIHGQFVESYKATLGAQFEYKIIKIGDTNYRVHFWDLAGQDRSPQVANLFARDSNGVIVVCEVNNKQSKEDALKWREAVIQTNQDDDLSMILLENKSDLVEGGDTVGVEEIENYASDNGFLKGYRTSAKTGFNVETAVMYLLQQIIEKNQFEKTMRDEGINEDEIVLQNKIQKEKKKSCC